MTDKLDQNRNPTIVPEQAPSRKRVCPKCGGDKFDSRIAYGMPTFICQTKDCGNVWQGGIIHDSPDSRVVYPPASYTPSISFDKALVRGSPHGNPNYISPDTVEIRRRVDPTPDFKKGAPLGEDEEI
jgi:hypothetical protein